MEVRGAAHVNDTIDGARGRIHDPNRRVNLLRPPGALRSVGIELPNLVGRSNVDVEAAEDVQLIVSDGKTTRQNRARRIARPVVGCVERLDCVGDWVITEDARGSRCLASCAATDTVDIVRATLVQYAAGHVIHLVVGQCYTHLSPAVAAWIVLEHMLKV